METGSAGSGGKKITWNYPVITPLLLHYYPLRWGYEAAMERLAALEHRLQRLEEYFALAIRALAGENVANELASLQRSSPPIASLITPEEEILAMDADRLALYVNGIADIRMLMPMTKVDKSKLPRFIIPIWVQDRASMIAQARELGLEVPAKYKE